MFIPISASYSVRSYMATQSTYLPPHPRSRQSMVPISSPSKAAQYQHHRRTQSSPFSYPSRPSPFPPDSPINDDTSHPSYAASYSQSFRESSARYSPYPASLPPRTASSIASSTLLDHIPDHDDDMSYADREQGYDAADDVDDAFAFSPVRRRVSFSTSAERDRPHVPDMPAVPPSQKIPSLKNLLMGGKEGDSLHEERVGRERERNTDRPAGRLSVRDGKKRAEDMLPTPPMSSPELEMAQPLPQRQQQQSQPLQRTPSIPVGSIATSSSRSDSQVRERRRKERPTLLDLLSSPQPSVSPERPPPTSSSFASEADTSPHRDQEERVSSPLRESLYPPPAPTRKAATEDGTSRRRDDSLPPSSPFSSPLSSPAKSARTASSLPPSAPPSPVMRERTPIAIPPVSNLETEELEHVRASSPLSSPPSSPMRSAAKALRERTPTEHAQPERDASVKPRELSQVPAEEGVSHPLQLPTPLTPECVGNPLEVGSEGSESMQVDEVCIQRTPADTDIKLTWAPIRLFTRPSHLVQFLHLHRQLPSAEPQVLVLLTRPVRLLHPLSFRLRLLPNCAPHLPSRP
ncbi:hypothetical protein BDW22DRAFT_805065 [Trametopsis cervina]|nr:hypothetical protein BDW22DRAFT_805065 [Trametopsis cervina]